MNAELAGSIYWNSERHRELVLARLAAVALEALQAGEGDGAIFGDVGAGVVPCLGFDRVEKGLAEGGGVGQGLLAAAPGVLADRAMGSSSALVGSGLRGR